MQLASGLTPLSDENMQHATQCGVDGVVTRYPSPNFDDLFKIKQCDERNGLNLLALEGYLPIEKIILGTDDETELAAMI